MNIIEAARVVQRGGFVKHESENRWFGGYWYDQRGACEYETSSGYWEYNSHFDVEEDLLAEDWIECDRQGNPIP